MGSLFMKIPAIIGALIGGVITWFLTRKKQAAEIERILEEAEKTRSQKQGIDLDNIESVIKLWKGMVESLTKEVHTLTIEVDNLRKENLNLKTEMKRLEVLLQKIKD